MGRAHCDAHFSLYAFYLFAGALTYMWPLQRTPTTDCARVENMTCGMSDKAANVRANVILTVAKGLVAFLF